MEKVQNNNDQLDVLLINPYPEDAYGLNETTVEPPLGLGYLASIAERNSVSCKIIDANVFKMRFQDVFNSIEQLRPKIVGITVNLFSYQISLKLTNKIKEKFPETIVMLGGPTPTCSYEKMMNACNVDAISIGESEDTFDEILKNMKKGEHLFKDVAGLIYRDKNEIIQNAQRFFIKDIDAIPFPAYHLFPDLNLYKSRSRKTPIAPILTSRGCPYNCVYCSKDVFKNKIRMRSPENVIEEIDMLVKNFGVKQLDILDDNFSMSGERMEKILDLLIERNYDLYLNLQSGIRIESIDQNIVNKMMKAKVFKVAFGVESGDEEILKKIKKHLNLDQLLKVSEMMKRAGIKVYGFFMIGLPGDTAESMQKTIDLAKKMNPNIANFSILIPFPGTEIYNMIKKEGKFLVNMDDGINVGFYSNNVFYELPGMNKDDVIKYYQKAMKSFYMRPIKILEIILSFRSAYELKWFVNTSFLMLKNLFTRKRK